MMDNYFHNLTTVPKDIFEPPIIFSTRIADFPLKDIVYGGLTTSELWRLAKKGNPTPNGSLVSEEEQLLAADTFLDLTFEAKAEKAGKELAMRLENMGVCEGTVTLLAPVGVTQGEEQSSRNVLPFLHAARVKDALEQVMVGHETLGDIKVEINPQFVQLSKTNSTDAGLMGKIAATPYFALVDENGHEIPSSGQKSDKIALIVEDDTEMGGASMAALAFAHERFSQVLGAVVVAASPGAVELPIKPETKTVLLKILAKDASEEKAEAQINRLLSPYGLSLDRISNIAGIGLTALLLDPENSTDQGIYEDLLEAGKITPEEMRDYEARKGKHLITKAIEDKTLCSASLPEVIAAWRQQMDGALRTRRVFVQERTPSYAQR